MDILVGTVLLCFLLGFSFAVLAVESMHKERDALRAENERLMQKGLEANRELAKQARTDADRIAELEAERDALRAELLAYLAEWNALVSAIGSRTHGGAVGHGAALLAERDALRAENERLKAICFDHELNFGAAEEEVARLTARVAELIDALDDYGQHDARCGHSRDRFDPQPCDCGLSAIIAGKENK